MTTINIYRSNGEWCYAAIVDGEHSDSDTLDVLDGATELEAEQAASAMPYPAPISVQRVADI